MNKKTANLYVRFTAQNPLPFIGFVALAVLSLFVLTMSTKLNVINTYDGVMNNQTIVISDHEIANMPSKVYVYTNRNEKVYPMQMTSEVQYDAGNTILYVEGSGSESDLGHVKVDVPIGETTLFERVFLKGGKVNGN
ncbi:hypothetical protein PAECIP111893_03046 [Paenibacillus plantiphilus]|uniref:ABC transporter permease n=1 Tax=Paenibacillus plantiphilus TaxID=2905650 RepID=A0ABM9CCU4_9BACL|nr:hypothetical protein [Paenibacillus plantiphilus]CAH1209526.1 hypothetical protein PAECIP111893_03046 [Paenibacillus plantiphilus]